MLHSIRARVLCGFAALILLQVAVAVAVWQAENRVDAATAADSVAEAAGMRIIDVRSGLSAVQWRAATFVRTGAAADRAQVEAALASLGTLMVQAGDMGHTSAELDRGVGGVRAALKAIIAAAIARRNGSDTLVRAADDAENSLAALAQAVTKASERAPLEVALPSVAATLHPLVFAQRFAVDGNDGDAQVVVASMVQVKEAMKALGDSGGLTPRIKRLIRAVTTSLDDLRPAMDKVAGAFCRICGGDPAARPRVGPDARGHHRGADQAWRRAQATAAGDGHGAPGGAHDRAGRRGGGRPDRRGIGRGGGAVDHASDRPACGGRCVGSRTDRCT